MRYLAIDYGQKRTGLAVCDAEERLACPLAVLTGQKNLIADISDEVKRQAVDAIVLGLPLNMDDTEGPAAKNVRNFAEQLKKHFDIPIHFHDERLSSFDAEKKLSGIKLTTKKKKKLLDAVAAAAILQSFLDKRHSG